MSDRPPVSIPMSLLEMTCDSVEENLAVDEALLIEADEGRAGAVLRFWESSRVAVVLGASRRRDQEVRLGACDTDGVPVLRRSSGGGTVVIGPGALNATIVLSGSAAPGLESVDGAQAFVLEQMARALATPGNPVKVLGSGDLTIHGRKFAGSAQRRLQRWFLIHCSILYDFPLELVSRYLLLPPRQPAYREGRSHKDFLSNLPIPRRIIEDLIRKAWSPSSSRSPTTDVPYNLLKSLLSDRFANRSWIERF